jgi:hypothetical protein
MPWPSRYGRRLSSKTRAMQLPRLWIVVEVLIVVFVLIGAVIAFTQLA